MSAALALIAEDNSYAHADWLAHAAEMRDRAELEALLANGVNVDAATKSGMTPLMYGALNGSVDIVQILLDAGAQINAKRNDGFSALDLAAFFGHPGVVRLLLQSGANPESRGRIGTSAERWAIGRGFIEIAEALRDASARYQNHQLPKQPSMPSAEIPGPTRDLNVNKLSSVIRPMELPVPKSEATLEAGPVTPPMAAEVILEQSPVRALPPVLVDTVHQQRQTVTQSTTGGAKTAVEVFENPTSPSQFRPGLVFLERITSSWRHLQVLTLSMIIAGGATYGMLRIKKQPGTSSRTTQLENATPPSTETKRLNEGSYGKITPEIETTSSSDAMAAAAQTSTTAGNGVGTDVPTKIELAHKPGFDRPTQQQKPALHAFVDSTNQTYTKPTRKPAEASPKRRNLDSIKTFAPSKPNPVAIATADPLSNGRIAEFEEPKPAPLSVSVSRTRSVTPPPSMKNEGRFPDQSLPISSTRPRRKVIQWP